MGAFSIEPGRHGIINDIVPLMVFSSKGPAMTFNRAARRLLGAGKQAGLSPDLHAAVYAILDEAGRKYRQERLPWIRALRLKRALRGVVCRFMMPDGSPRWFDVAAVPVRDSQSGEVGSVVCKLTDITGLKRSQDHLLDDLRLGKTIATCYSRTICAAAACPDCGIFRSVLGMAAKRLGPAGRLYVFENHLAADNGLCARCVCCVTAQSNRNKRGAEMHVAWKAMPGEWHASLSMGKQVVVESRTPEMGGDFLDRIGIKSCVLMPMFHAREWIGFVVVGDALPGRLSRKECLRLARKITDATCSMIEHKRARARMLQARKMEMLGT